MNPAPHPLRFETPADLPGRAGPAPRVHPGPPQHQIDQLPDRESWTAMRALVERWDRAETGPSLRAAPGTVGLFLPDGDPHAGSSECFLIGTEFAHHHPGSDGGLHLVLPPDWHEAALAKGWAVPHTWAGRPTVSRWTVLVFAPRTADELAVAAHLVAVAQGFARGEHEAPR